MRLIRRAGASMGDAPTSYPHIGDQIKFKRALRAMHKKYKMNRYLADSDSDLNDYESVASNVKGGNWAAAYEEKYKQLIRPDRALRDKREIDAEKRAKLDRVLGKPFLVPHVPRRHYKSQAVFYDSQTSLRSANKHHNERSMNEIAVRDGSPSPLLDERTRLLHADSSIANVESETGLDSAVG